MRDIKSGCMDKKFTGLDQHMKAIYVDTVKVLEGPLAGRRGIVRQIYKCQMCEKIKLFNDCQDNSVDDSGPAGFEDLTTSPKSPPSSKTAWQAIRENNQEFNNNRKDREGAFSIGQTLRIRIGPLKGHLFRVIAIYRTDVTVKLDSQLKVISAVLFFRPDTLDLALLHSRRLDRKVEFGLPELESRTQIFKIHTRTMNCERDIRFELLARLPKFHWS